MSVSNNKGNGSSHAVEDITGKLIAAAIHTTALNHAARSAVSAVLRDWSNGKYLKGKIADLAERLIIKFLSEQAGTGVSADELIRSFDFGEVKEAADRLEVSLPAFVRTTNDVLWNYPAKPVSAAACIPSLVNTGIKVITEFIRPLNTMDPELLADVLFSLLRSIKGKEIGALANTFMELSRKVYTGSQLVSDANASQFSLDARALMQDIVFTIDPQLLSKFQVAWAEARETIATSYAHAVLQNPKVFTTVVSSYADRKNPGIRSARIKLGVFESLPEKEVADAVLSGLAELDTHEIGEVINALIRYLKLISVHKPEFIPHILSEIVMSVDTDELRTVADSVIAGVFEAIKPAARMLMPALLKGLASLLEPDENQAPGELNEAILLFKKTLMSKEE